MSDAFLRDRSAQHRQTGGSGIAILALVLAVIALAGSALSVVLVLNGGAQAQPEASATAKAAMEETVRSRPSPSPKPTQPRNQAGARAAAQQIFDLYSAGSYGAYWDHWSRATQQVVSREDYVRRFKLCKPVVEGLRFQVSSVTVAGAHAKVVVARSIMTFTHDFVYEDGQWRFVPSEDVQKDYRTKSIDQLVSEDRAQSLCG
ncbi:hypothetical protein [Microbispora sp. CA-102843]|uniref:hypothetical protein n=1 Tax=Microbispora sp. CA-102843 TaxID=3239952 RepID=UPI003D8A5EA9